MHFSKFTFESQFQNISSGGAISYVEIPNLRHNLTALEEVVKFIYDNIQYAEFNTKSDYCHECGYDGEIIINDEGEWECPQCHNKDHNKMNVTRRTCGYLGENFWNVGKTKEIKARVVKAGFNEKTWDFNNGELWTPETEDALITELSRPYYKGLTIPGGEPFDLQNQPEICELILRVKRTT